MSSFDVFCTTHSPKSHYRNCDIAHINFYANKVPGSLLTHWQKEGWGAYASGFLWIVNPDDLEDLLEDWLEIDVDPPIIIARTAFADLFLWGQDGVHFLNVSQGVITRVSNDINSFFNVFLCDQKSLDLVLKQDIYKDAYKRLGTPKFDECYAFIPALALGGSGKPDSVQIVKMREHLGFLSQLVTE